MEEELGAFEEPIARPAGGMLGRERELREAKAEAAELVQALAAGQAELLTSRAEASSLRRELESAQLLLEESAQTEFIRPFLADTRDRVVAPAAGASGR